MISLYGEIEGCEYPINGAVVVLIDSVTKTFGYSTELFENVFGSESDYIGQGFTRNDNLAVNSNFSTVLDWKVIPKQ